MQYGPAKREIPAGKTLVASAGIPDDQIVTVKAIATAYSTRLRSTVRLVHVSPGFEPAGSLSRWTNGYWAVWFCVGAARHGKRFPDDPTGEAEARAYFTRLTQEGE